MYLNTTESSTVISIDNHILRYIHQPTSEVSRIGCFKRCIGKSLTRSVGRDKVLQDRKTFLKVRKDRVLNDLAPTSGRFLWLSHQTTHTGKLANLFLGTTRPRVKHHIYRVEPLSVLTDTLHR